MKNIIHNIFASNIQDKNSPILSRIKLINAFLLAATGIMSFALIYRIFNEPVLSLIIIDTCTTCINFSLFLYLRKTKKIDQVAFLSSALIILFMVTFIYINKNIDFGLSWSYMVPFFVIFSVGYRVGVPLVVVYYFLIFATMHLNYGEWLLNGWNQQSLIRYIITSTALTIMAASTEHTFSSHQKKLSNLIKTDDLTSLNSRRNIEFIIDYELAKNTRSKHPIQISFAIFDIDNFKLINDTFGHPTGDRVLKELGEIINKNTRVTDYVGRWGGEEFCVFFSDTNYKEAFAILNKLREYVENHDFKVDRSVTCSFGLCSTSNPDIKKESLIARADSYLYEAKNSGKNKICGSTIV